MISWSSYQIGQHRIECPSCGRGKRDKTAGLKIDADASGVLHCFRCSLVESFWPERRAVAHQSPNFKPKVHAQKPQYRGLSDWGLGLWNKTQDLSGVAAQYLSSRKCVVPAYGDLRWHPSLRHPSGFEGPALVALISDVMTNEPLSLHQTWITSKGKADIETPRLLLGNHSIDGGVIRIWPDKDVHGVLGIAEGIETALSMAHALTPVWATIDAGHMKKFPVIDSISRLYIAQDNDSVGISAAANCSRRWADAGKEVFLICQAENDLNDVLTGRSM